MEAGKIYRLKPSTVAVLKSPALVKKIGPLGATVSYFTQRCIDFTSAKWL
jgi:hypothetical protein